MKSKKTGGVVETIMTIVYAVVIAITVRTVAYEPFNIPSGSMIPTLLVGDYLFVSKFSYGYSRYSLPLGLPLFSGRILRHEPTRGDVVVFKWPKDNSTDYIKRLIGLPGDHVRVTKGVLYLNGVAAKREPIERYIDPESHRPVQQFTETLPNGIRHPIIKLTDDSPFNNWPDAADPQQEKVVPPDSYFMMGDNRDNSADSREWGFVPAENLVGPAQFTFFSTDGSAHWWEVWNWPFAIRYGRLFQGIH
jgi:signal peptidase I